MEFVPMLAMAFLVYQIISFFRFLRGGDVNGALTIAITWFAGVVVVLLVGETDWADGINVGDQNLAVLNFWSKLFLGLTLSSLAGFGNDLLGSIDRFRTTAKPRLVDGETVVPAVVVKD